MEYIYCFKDKFILYGAYSNQKKLNLKNYLEMSIKRILIFVNFNLII